MLPTLELKGDQVKRVGLLFSGGPAPAANAVISAAAISFLEDSREVIGFFHGYSNLQEYHPITNRLLPEIHYRILKLDDVRGIRNQRGILIGTARANPGKLIKKSKDLESKEKTELLRNTYNALVDLEIDALISIGGDDTLKTANLLHQFQNTLPENAKKIKVVHLPKTIDNDYNGIDFTFGFFTAVDFMAKEIQNLRADSMATSSYFIVETMGRKAGWLSYGVGIAGEANLVLSIEDINEEMMQNDDGVRCLDPTTLADVIVDLIQTRAKKGKHYGVVVLAEGLTELLPPAYIKDVTRDPHGHLSLSKVDLGKLMAQLVSERHLERFGVKKKVTGIQLGYESRCAPPHAFDVMLGSQLGIGSYRALVEEGLDGHMVSVSGQLDLHYVPFSDLINQENLLTEVRFIKSGSDFHRLARFLETRTDHRTWTPGPRTEEPPQI